MQGALKNQARIIDSFLTIAILIPVLQLLVRKMDTFIPCQLMGVLWKWLHNAGKELRQNAHHEKPPWKLMIPYLVHIMDTIAIMHSEWWRWKEALTIHLCSQSIILQKSDLRAQRNKSIWSWQMKTVDDCINHRWRKLNLKPLFLFFLSTVWIYRFNKFCEADFSRRQCF